MNELIIFYFYLMSFPKKKRHPQFKEEEEKQIKEALKTTFDKVMSILTNVTKCLKGNSLEKDVKWVIKVIQSRQLYTYEVENVRKDSTSFEMRSLMGYLDEYCERKNKIEGLTKKIYQTTKLDNSPYDFYKKRISPDLKFTRNLCFPIENDSNNKEKYPSSELIFDDNSSEEEHKDSLSNYNDKSRCNNDKDSLGNSNLFTPESKSSQIQYCINGESWEMQEKQEMVFSSPQFDVFDYFDTYGDKAFVHGSYCILSKLSLDKYSSSEKVINFIKTVKDNYSNEAFYHNEKHGFDVLQTIFVYISSSHLVSSLLFSDIDLIALGVGALVHDLGHKGYTNDFQIKTQSDLAIQYNDKSVWENYHLATAFQIIRKRNNEILEKAQRDDYKIFRKRMIECVLHTDMLFHSKNIALMTTHIDNDTGKLLPFSQENIFDEQQDVMNFILHSADISHCSKEFNINYKWTELLSQEFFRQGDLEEQMNLPVGFLCDRKTSNVPRSQIGFIKGIILPTFELLALLLPEVSCYRDNAVNNLQRWDELIQESDEK